jgi:hypothetical protein
MANYLKVLLDKLELLDKGLYSVLEEVVEFCGEADEVDGSNVPAVNHRIKLPWHRKPALVVEEVAVFQNQGPITNINSNMEYSYGFTN